MSRTPYSGTPAVPGAPSTPPSAPLVGATAPAAPLHGPLAASTPDFDKGGIRQVGHKPGTVGQSVPGVALRVVDDSVMPLPPDTDGRLQALLPGRPDWVETGFRARLDRDGFVRLAEDVGS